MSAAAGGVKSEEAEEQMNEIAEVGLAEADVNATPVGWGSKWCAVVEVALLLSASHGHNIELHGHAEFGLAFEWAVLPGLERWAGPAVTLLQSTHANDTLRDLPLYTGGENSGRAMHVGPSVDAGLTEAMDDCYSIVHYYWYVQAHFWPRDREDARSSCKLKMSLANLGTGRGQPGWWANAQQSKGERAGCRSRGASQGRPMR